MKRKQTLPTFAVIAGVITFISLFAGLVYFAETTPGTADTMGYVYASQRLAQGKGVTYEDPLNELVAPFFSPYAFQISRSEDSRMFLGFPPGLPILMSIGGLISAAGVHYVVPVLAACCLLLVFALGFELTQDERIAAGATLIVAMTSVFWEFSTAAWSEVPSAVFILLGFWLYLKGRQRQNTQETVFLLLAAFSFIFSWYIRYTNITVLPALLVFEVATNKFDFLRRIKIWIFGLTLFIGAVSILLFNEFYYGGYNLTSYSPENGWYPLPAFAWEYALGPSFVGGFSLIEMGRVLWNNLHIFLVFLPLGLIKLPWEKALLLFTAPLLMLAPYAIYAFAATGINSRFIFTSIPFVAILMAVGIFWVIDQISSRAGQWSVVVLLLGVVIWNTVDSLNTIDQRNQAQKTGMQHIVSLVDWSEPDAVFLSYAMNDHFSLYGERSVFNYRRLPRPNRETQSYEWEYLETCMAQYIVNVQDLNRPVYFVEDGDPPYGDSLNLIKNHFELELVRAEPNIYRINSPIHDIAEALPTHICP
ncbi:MAG: hypothetical protein QNJ45_07370 [Ardenticatenaceae bacterium]|nr:hypothetical protein [Ardenticatenaceae bacterium]